MHDSRYARTMNVFDVSQPTVAIAGRDERFAVRRVFCIGKNYAAHVRELGGNPDREPPFYFSKAADTVTPDGSVVAYPPRTRNFHHEIELVVAIGKAGADIPAARAAEYIFGYAVGIDLTRRDLQAEAKNAGRPWDTAKNFDQSAPIGAIHTVDEVGHPTGGRIWLAVNGAARQDADVGEMIWSVAESIAETSTFCALAPGDLIFTGTPAGVGPLSPGDKVTGGIAGIGEISIEIR